jgi:hypothetical protein
MTPKEKADELYKDAYMRWCYELSHDKNHLTAKDIAHYVCDKIISNNKTLGLLTQDTMHNNWFLEDVKKEIDKL